MTLTGPGDLIAPGGGSGVVTVATQPECAWTAAAEASWITNLSPAQGQGSGEVRFQAGANPNGTARESAIVINDQRAAIRQGAAACQLDVAASANNFGASGGAGTLTIAGTGGCAWNASSDVSWIALSPLSGAGSGTVNFTVALNTGTARTGTITVGTFAIEVMQAGVGGPAPPTCSITLQPTSTTIAAAGGPGSIGITTAAGCSWTASTPVTWITLTPPTNGNGNGSLGFAVAANTSTTGRIGSINIGGATFTVNQAGSTGTSCTVSINPTSQSAPASGANGVNVTVSTAAGCTWTATSNAPAWLTVASGESGTGNGSVSVNVAANTGIARSGTVTIGGQTFTVNQAAAACSFSINPTSQSISAAGGAGTPVAVTAPAGCAWTASSNAPTWLTITSGAGGSGNGTVNFTIGQNTGGARNGTLTIAGQTFTVSQAAVAAPTCTYSINPTAVTVGHSGANNLSVSVSAGAGCSWTAVSNTGFLDIDSGNSGSGNGTVIYDVDNYNGNNTRTGTMTIAGQTFTVTQVRCSYTISPGTQSVPALGGSFSVAVTTQIGCGWSVQENLSWVTGVKPSNGTGSGSVSYTVLANTGGARSGNVSIGGQTLTINQAAIIP